VPAGVTELRFATFLAPALLPLYEAVADHIGERLGLPVSLVEGSSLEQFAAGEVDAGFV
jgi:hypothetical protein